MARAPNLLAWQWSLYPDNHRDRANLLIHIVTVPIFWSGTLGVLSAFTTQWWMALVGLGMMAFAFALQGVGHGREPASPVPFEGPLDVVGRIFLEQWINFPRYVLSGRWMRAWRGEAPTDGA